MKTNETLALENALYLQSKKKREYGCTEVTIGFDYQGLGKEIVDYMSMDSKNTFRCYEIKVSLSDLKTDNKKSFYGQYNYLVVSQDLYDKHPVWENYIPPYVGIIVGETLTIRKKAKAKVISQETTMMLTSSLLRTLYYKMDEFRNINDLEENKKLKKQLQQTVLQTEKKEKELALINWTYHDFEHYYGLNHQLINYQIAQDAKEQRRQYQERINAQFTWIRDKDSYICPVCKGKALYYQDGKVAMSDYCPACGSDLRKLKKEG